MTLRFLFHVVFTLFCFVDSYLQQNKTKQQQNKVNNFGDAFKDGKIFAALIASIDPYFDYEFATEVLFFFFLFLSFLFFSFLFFSFLSFLFFSFFLTSPF